MKVYLRTAEEVGRSVVCRGEGSRVGVDASHNHFSLSFWPRPRSDVRPGVAVSLIYLLVPQPRRGATARCLMCSFLTLGYFVV